MTIKRILSFIIDVAIINIAIMVIATISKLISQQIYLYAVSLMIPLMLLRDSFTGQSIGRKLMNIAVYHKESPVHPFRALVRNLFTVLWPIELLTLLVANKRIGDYVTDTNVKVSKMKLTLVNAAWSIGLFFALWISTILILQSLFSNSVASLLLI